MSSSGTGALAPAMRAGPPGRASGAAARAKRAARARGIGVRAVALGYLGLLLLAPVGVIFSVTGIVFATAVVSLPFVARETMPVLRELGTDAEQAAATLGASGWQTFWRVTLPGIRWGVVYGVVLATARALGEFGAVSVVSGRIGGQTQTLPLYVQDRFENFDITGAYAASVVLALLALGTLLAMSLLTRRAHERGAP